MRIVLGLEYDGSSFSGWQSQRGGNTVQDVLECSLERIAGVPLRTICAGRTDTGVHALAQVVHFDTAVERPLTAWVRGVNAHLPVTVAVQWAMPVGMDFHARFAARSRSYRYLLLNRSQRPGLWSKKLGWYHRALDLGAMREAASYLLGEHDFSSFRSAECQAKSPVKTLILCDISRTDDLLSFEFRASAFLHHMVRNLVGALVAVGSGRLALTSFIQILEVRDRRQAPPTFSPEGLYFTGVEYDSGWGLPQDGRIIAESILPIT